MPERTCSPAASSLSEGRSDRGCEAFFPQALPDFPFTSRTLAQVELGGGVRASASVRLEWVREGGGMHTRAQMERTVTCMRLARMGSSSAGGRTGRLRTTEETWMCRTVVVGHPGPHIDIHRDKLLDLVLNLREGWIVCNQSVGIVLAFVAREVGTITITCRISKFALLYTKASHPRPLGFIRTLAALKVPCSYLSTAMGKFALLRYLSDFRLRVSSF